MKTYLNAGSVVPTRLFLSEDEALEWRQGTLE